MSGGLWGSRVWPAPEWCWGVLGWDPAPDQWSVGSRGGTQRWLLRIHLPLQTLAQPSVSASWTLPAGGGDPCSLRGQDVVGADLLLHRLNPIQQPQAPAACGSGAISA